MGIEQVPRTVKPRKTGYTDLPLLVIRKGRYVTENGVTGDTANINWRTLKPVLVVGVNLAYFLSELDERYRANADWQWKARDQEMEIGRVATQHRTVIDFFGFKANREKGHRANHYHYCLDAFTFYSNSYTLGPETTDTLQGLMKWATKLRDYCQKENLPLRPTASAIAASYLRDPRFYAKPRRKVPRATNAAVRPAMPGNHYQLSVATRSKTRYNALEIDQTRAHHYHAATTPLPHSDTLFAFGDFERLTHECAKNPHPNFIGLYYLRLRTRNRRGLHPRWSPVKSQHSSDDRFFVFSNEMSMLRDHGYEPVGIIAGWGSRIQDNDLPRYARHCQSQLDQHDDAAWLKPILLSTYGLLAVTPRVPSAVFRRANGGEPYVLMAGGYRSLHGLLCTHTNGHKIEPGIANVLHRAMIEAATRAESLGLAQYLEASGQWVLQVYADSVIIEDNPDRPLPFLPEPWRIKQRLTDYRPINVQAFTSVEKTRLPGVGRDEILPASIGTMGRAPRRNPQTQTGLVLYTDLGKLGLEPSRA